MLAMQLEHQIASGSPSQDVVGTHTYDSQRVSVDQEIYSAEAENSAAEKLALEYYFGVVGAGFPGKGTSQGFEWVYSDHSPEVCEADTDSVEEYCLVEVDFANMRTF